MNEMQKIKVRPVSRCDSLQIWFRLKLFATIDFRRGKFVQNFANFCQIFLKFSPIFVNFHHFAHQIGRNDGNSSPTMRETRIGSLSAVNLAEIGRNLQNSGRNFSKWAPQGRQGRACMS